MTNSEARTRAQESHPDDQCPEHGPLCTGPTCCCRDKHRAADLPVATDSTTGEARDRGLAEYLDAMDQAGGGIYTADFRDGFRHALAMLTAFESDAAPDQVRPEVREAARLALSRRPAPEPSDRAGLSETEREVIYRAGDHGPEVCDCSAYIVEQAFAEDDCCQGLLDTFEVVESLFADRLAVAEQARAERDEARRATSYARRQRDEERSAKEGNWRALGEWSARAEAAEQEAATLRAKVDNLTAVSVEITQERDVLRAQVAAVEDVLTRLVAQGADYEQWIYRLERDGEWVSDRPVADALRAALGDSPVTHRRRAFGLGDFLGLKHGVSRALVKHTEHGYHLGLASAIVHDLASEGLLDGLDPRRGDNPEASEQADGGA